MIKHEAICRILSVCGTRVTVAMCFSGIAWKVRTVSSVPTPSFFKRTVLFLGWGRFCPLFVLFLAYVLFLSFFMHIFFFLFWKSTFLTVKISFFYKCQLLLSNFMRKHVITVLFRYLSKGLCCMYHSNYNACFKLIFV